jgi:hypothetical protein
MVPKMPIFSRRFALNFYCLELRSKVHFPKRGQFRVKEYLTIVSFCTKVPGDTHYAILQKQKLVLISPNMMPKLEWPQVSGKKVKFRFQLFAIVGEEIL